jgi:hypothetical protein
MRIWRQVSLAFCAATLFTVWSVWLRSFGGEYLSLPGIIIEGWTNILIILITDDPYAGFFNRMAFFNFGFYFCVFYGLLWMIFKNHMQADSKPSAR